MAKTVTKVETKPVEIKEVEEIEEFEEIEESVSKKDDEEINALKAQVAELMKMVEQVTSAKNEEKAESVEIPLNKYVSVMSLFPYKMVLSTAPYGRGGTQKVFDSFGQVVRILYKDLINIIDVHRNFLNAGYFYILDKDVIRENALDEVYSKILDKESITRLLHTNSPEEAEKLYNSANDTQKELIVRMLVDSVRDNPGDINLNIVDRISRASGFNIVESATQARETEKRLAEGEGKV